MSELSDYQQRVEQPRWRDYDTKLAEMSAKLFAAEAENAKLREALKPFAEIASCALKTTNGHYGGDDPWYVMSDAKITYGDLRRARAALNGGE
ncbi:MAG: hypothetical protein ACRCUC_02235 [Aestuariivirga sp.]